METELVCRVVHLHNQTTHPNLSPISFYLIFNMPSTDDIRMAELREEMARLEHKVAEEARRAEEERIAKEAEEALLAKLEEEKRIAEEERKQKEEEEQRQAAIALAKYQRNAEKAEVEKIEAANASFKKCEDADVTFHKANVKVQQELKAKARKEAVTAKRSESEKAEGLGKQGREEREISLTVRSFLMVHGVEWMVNEGMVCESCEKKERKGFWRMEAGRGKACLACHNLKTSCSASGEEESETEAGLSKRRKVEGKGKGKEKAASPNSGVAESAATDVLRDILKELKGLHAEVGDLRVFAQRTTSVAENRWRTQRQISSCVADLCWHFMPDNGEGSVGTEDKEESGVGAENKEMRDAEMEESGGDMADNAMDETLH